MSHSGTTSTTERSPVIVIAAGTGTTEEEGAINEIKALLQGLGYEICHTLIQRHAPRGGTAILGEGKLQELKELIEDLDAKWGVTPFLAFVCELSPSQQRLLERDFDTVVLDRTGIILRVFESRARTRLSKLEIELARAIYGAPRIRDDKALDDREGGGGRGGRGNSNVELAKQALRERTVELRREIEIEQSHRRRRAERREKAPRVALVGYTNAGKSSWMRTLTGSEVLVENKLFATLDTTVRAMHPETVPRILIADTVGFIQDLPHTLVASFRSTLDEALDTDLLIHVVDAADARMLEHLTVTEEVLHEVGADEIPARLILNKMDLVSPERRAELEELYPNALFLSCRDAGDVLAVREEIIQFFENPLTEHNFSLPFSELGRISELRKDARVIREDFTDEGVTITFLTDERTLKVHGLVPQDVRAKEAWEE